MTDDRRALAERLAQRVFDKYRQGQEERYDALAEQPSHDRERAILCVLAGLAHGRVAALDAVPSDFPRDPGETFTTDAVRAFVRRREREAARRGYEAGYSVGHAEGKVWQHRRTAFTPSPSLSVAEARDYYLDREYPAPSPPSVTLSDGSVVTRRITGGAWSWVREKMPNARFKDVQFWQDLLDDTDTIGDQKKVAAFAALRGTTTTEAPDGR